MRRCDSENRVKVLRRSMDTKKNTLAMKLRVLSLCIRHISSLTNRSERIVAEDFGAFFLDQIKAQL